MGGLIVYLPLPLLVPRFLMSLSFFFDDSSQSSLFSLLNTFSSPPCFFLFPSSLFSHTFILFPSPYFIHLSSLLVSPPSFHTGGYNHLDVVEYLLEKGADVNAKDKGGLIPLHNAASYGVRSCNLIMTPNSSYMYLGLPHVLKLSTITHGRESPCTVNDYWAGVGGGEGRNTIGRSNLLHATCYYVP